MSVSYTHLDVYKRQDKIDAKHVEEQVISAGHFHGMPLALAMSYVTVSYTHLDVYKRQRTQLVAVARGAAVELDAAALVRVARAADFLAAQVDKQEPIYGVSTGFGSNADKLLGAHRLRDELPGAVKSGQPPHIELQRNLIITHAVCVGEPFAREVVRAMLLSLIHI